MPATSATGMAAKADEGNIRAADASVDRSIADCCYYCCALTATDLQGALRLHWLFLSA